MLNLSRDRTKLHQLFLPVAAWLVVAMAAPAIEWTAPAMCPDAELAARTVAVELDDDSELRVVANVTASEAGFSAELTISSASGETTRTLSSPRCTTLLDAVALIAAAAQEEATSEVAESSEGRVPVVPDTVTDSEGPVSSVSVQRRRDSAPTETKTSANASLRYRAVAMHLRAYGRAGVGLMPQFDAGAGLAAGLGWRRLRIEAFGAATTGAELEIERLSTATARILAWSAGLRGCAVAWTNASEVVALPLCVRASAGQFIGIPGGSGLVDARRKSMAWSAVAAGPALLLRITPQLSVVADLELLVPVLRPGFSVAGAGNEEPEGLVHRPKRAALSATVGIEVHFPRRIHGTAGMR